MRSLILKLPYLKEIQISPELGHTNVKALMLAYFRHYLWRHGRSGFLRRCARLGASGRRGASAGPVVLSCASQRRNRSTCADTTVVSKASGAAKQACPAPFQRPPTTIYFLNLYITSEVKLQYVTTPAAVSRTAASAETRRPARHTASHGSAPRSQRRQLGASSLLTQRAHAGQRPHWQPGSQRRPRAPT